MRSDIILFPNSLVEEPEEYQPLFDQTKQETDTLYNTRQDQSARKLDSFFGEHLPLDICISEIRKQGLKAMLKSRVPLCFFLRYLIKTERYDKLKTVPKQQWISAHHIFALYLTDSSPFELNVSEEVRSKVISLIKSHKVDHCFDSAKNAVYLILESSFIRFCGTSIWNTMVSCCGECTTYYDKRTRERVVDDLVSFLEHQHNNRFNNPLVDAPVLSSVRRSAKIRQKRVKAMINNFSQTELHLGPKRFISNTMRPKSWSVLGFDLSVLKKGACS
ncbi:hypothetical protein CLU79DRAFT_833115 [Phycomyces nitens]|nr:hypothetical protein CLU79DRAFT_833115 [Phycomyces nitens]